MKEIGWILSIKSKIPILIEKYLKRANLEQPVQGSSSIRK